MQFRHSLGFVLLVGVLLLICMVMGFFVWFYPEWLGVRAASDRQLIWVFGVTAAAVVILAVSAAYRWLGRNLGHSTYQHLPSDDARALKQDTPDKSPVWGPLRDDFARQPRPLLAP